MGEMLLNGRLYGASGIRELTQAQYDALPASKLTDGILYCIKDTGIVEGEKFAPVIYSLDEREIGTWKDGKPLYQKTYYLAQANGNTDTIIDNTADLAVIDTICSITGSAINNYNEPIPMPFSYPNLNMCCGITIVTSGIRVTVGSFFTKLTDVYVTLRYTKTADTPGSGTWGTDGVPMVHYDGNERIIGTWFGETLYEKTLIPTQLTSDLATEDFTVSNIKQIIRCSGRISNNANTLCANVPFYINNDYRVGFETRVQATSTVRCKSYFGVQSPSSYKITDITIQYTKTS